MFKVFNQPQNESCSKETPVAQNMKVRKVTKNHPRVNLPVFRKDRNKQIKVFSVRTNEIKHKRANIDTQVSSDNFEFSVPHNCSGYTPSNHKIAGEIDINLDRSLNSFVGEHHPQLKRKLFSNKESSNFIMNQNTNIQRFLINNGKIALSQDLNGLSNSYQHDGKTQNGVQIQNHINSPKPKLSLRPNNIEILETVALKPKLVNKNSNNTNVARRYKSVNQRTIADGNGNGNEHRIFSEQTKAHNDSEAHYPIQAKDYWKSSPQELIDNEVISSMTPRK